MKDKETKEWEKKLRKLELLETNYGFQGRDDSYQIDYEILIDFIESIEQEAERRGAKKMRDFAMGLTCVGGNSMQIIDAIMWKYSEIEKEPKLSEESDNDTKRVE